MTPEQPRKVLTVGEDADLRRKHKTSHNSSNSSPVPRLLTIKQAATYCSCAVWAIREAIWSKELAACRIGRRFLVDRDTLDSFIDSRLRQRA
jgi:excisionase family DNA binding protein